MSTLRTRWAAIGAALAITFGAGGIGLVAATGHDDATSFVPITPCRLFDTRPALQVGPRSSPLGPNDTHTVTAHGASGDCDLPTDAVAVSMNVTAVGATLPTFLTIWATGGARPDASSLNPSPGQPPTPNAVTTGLSTSGQFDVFNLQGSVHVFADVNGYLVAPRITGDDVVDGSLRLGDLGGSRGELTTTVNAPIALGSGQCKSQLTGNFGATTIGNLVIATLADADGDPVLPNSAAVVPTVVIGTTQGGAVPNLLVCNTGNVNLTVPAGSVFTWRMIDP